MLFLHRSDVRTGSLRLRKELRCDSRQTTTEQNLNRAIWAARCRGPLSPHVARFFSFSTLPMILRLQASPASKQLVTKLSPLGERNRDLALRGIVTAFSLSRQPAPTASVASERIDVTFDTAAPENRRLLASLNLRPTRAAVSRLLSSALLWHSSPR